MSFQSEADWIGNDALNDNNGRYAPYYCTDPVTGIKSGAWLSVMQKYSKTRLLAKCPALFTKGATISYWSNGYLNYWDAKPPVMESFVRLRTSTVYLQDGPPSEALTGFTDANHNWWGPPHTWSTAKDSLDAERRHNGGANVLFCDWHVRRVLPQEFATSMMGTASDNPLIGIYKPPSPWDENGDGRPWYRPD